MNAPTLIIIIVGCLILAALLIVLLVVNLKCKEDRSSAGPLKGDLAPVEEKKTDNETGIEAKPESFTPDVDLRGVSVLYSCPKWRRAGIWTCSACGAMNSVSEDRCIVCNKYR